MKGRVRLYRPHWTPRYIVDRAALEVAQRRDPTSPWWTAAAVDFVEQWIRDDDQCLEWGSGRSSVWLTDRGVDVATVEHHDGWAAEVSAGSHGPGSLKMALVSADDAAAYVGAHPDVEAVDLAVVDGVHRSGCALRAARVLRPGGLLLVDNVERYLPSDSRSPEAIGDATPETEWHAFAATVRSWRRYWTSNGVTDTALWIKPPDGLEEAGRSAG